MVIGCAPGASCLGPAYEFLFEAHHALKQRKLCHKAPIDIHNTPEPFLGHFGVGGFGKIRQYLEGELEDRDVRYHTSAAITNITGDSVETVAMAQYSSLRTRSSFRRWPASRLSRKRPVLANPKGFVTGR